MGRAGVQRPQPNAWRWAGGGLRLHGAQSIRETPHFVEWVSSQRTIASCHKLTRNNDKRKRDSATSFWLVSSCARRPVRLARRTKE